MAKQAGIKDPFASPVLPRSFYHPTLSRGVDTSVAITGPGRDQESKTSEADAHFLQKSATLIPALAYLNPYPLERQHDVPMDFNTSNRSGDHFHETWPESEQPSATSFQGDISPFTSVSAEAETDKIPEQHRAEYNSGRYSACNERGTNETPVKSVLQKYIERFRNSEPKSRTERAKENEANYGDFWWMHSSPSSPADGDLQARRKQSPLISAPGRNDSNAHVPYEKRKLTKEAVMELDKETSNLQTKADHILNKSQLSLASSGPIVSTQGLGSSISASEYSLKTDSQAPYRPAFVNIREQSSLSDTQKAPMKANYKQHAVSQDSSSPPGDILVKWRLRRKMDEAKTSPARNTKPFSKQGIARNREMDVRLEEFRQKLLSQRALVTREEIQFERQKMKMLMEEEADKISNLKDKEPATSESNIQSNGVDPILVRLKTITSTMAMEPPTTLDLSEENAKNIARTTQNVGSIPKKMKSGCGVTDNSIQMDSNVNNACSDSNKDLNISESLNVSTWSLNKNNTALSVGGDSLNNEKHQVIDHMTSIVLCDPKNKRVILNERSDSSEDIRVKGKNKTNSLSSHGPNEKRTEGNVLVEERKAMAKKGSHSVDSVHSDGSSSAKSDYEKKAHSVPEKQVYRQYLVAEKPNVDVIPKVQEKVQEEEDGSSSQGSEKSLRTRKVKKNRKNDENRLVEKKSQRANNFPKQDIDKENLETDTSSKASHRQGTFLSKVPSNKKQETSKNQHPTELDPEDIAASSRQTSRNSHQTSFSKDRKQVSTSVPGPSQSSSQQNIQTAVIQTVADHLFDGPSVISSVDSWASLFPQSPAPSKSLYDSDLASPSPHRGNASPMQSTDLASPSPHRGNASPMQSTPSRFSSLAITETELGSSESDSEFEDDPLLSLLRQQRQDYVKKLEAIESALIRLER